MAVSYTGFQSEFVYFMQKAVVYQFNTRTRFLHKQGRMQYKFVILFYL